MRGGGGGGGGGWGPVFCGWTCSVDLNETRETAGGDHGWLGRGLKKKTKWGGGGGGGVGTCN